MAVIRYHSRHPYYLHNPHLYIGHDLAIWIPLADLEPRVVDVRSVDVDVNILTILGTNTKSELQTHVEI